MSRPAMGYRKEKQQQGNVVKEKRKTSASLARGLRSQGALVDGGGRWLQVRMTESMRESLWLLRDHYASLGKVETFSSIVKNLVNQEARKRVHPPIEPLGAGAGADRGRLQIRFSADDWAALLGLAHACQTPESTPKVSDIIRTLIFEEVYRVGGVDPDQLP